MDGMHLSEYLEKMGMSQAEFARQIGVRQPNVVRWANGTVIPRRAKIKLIEKFTGGLVNAASWYSYNREDAA